MNEQIKEILVQEQHRQSKSITVNAELDDKAHAVGDFIQQQPKEQHQKLEALRQECKDKEWIFT